MLEEKITIGTDTPLNGLLTLPDDSQGPFPAVVLVQGSGPSDMNEHIGQTYFFRDLAEGLAKRGIASIRYDKRSFVYGKDMVKDPSMSVREETIDDALLATALLKAEPRIDPKRVFIIGHSMGAMLAPRIDAEGGDFAGLLLLAGSPRRLEEILLDQQEAVLKQSGAFIRWLAKKQVQKLSDKFTAMYTWTEEKAKATPILGKNVRAYYLKEFGEKPASRYLANLTKPILVLQGEADFQVSLDKDFEQYKLLLADHADASFKLYPHLNHLFMPSVYGDIRKAKKEYDKAQQVDDSVLDDLASWIHRH